MVLRSMVERARELNAQSAVVTFDPHTSRVLQNTVRKPLLTTLAQKLDLLAATGLDLALVLPFTPELRHWSAREFAERVLRDGLHTVEVHEGETFHFGYGAEGDVSSLSELGRELGFAVRAYEPRILDGAPVSSSRIRALIGEGKIFEANALLGRNFAVRSTPASGRGYGTRYTVPTINLAPYDDLLPAHGVYVTKLAVGAEASRRVFQGVTNVGNRPTFGADSFAVETHLLDFEPIELTEATPLELSFLARLREERRFDSPEALREQIGCDVAEAKLVFARETQAAERAAEL
jgi:riboflavin kinase/FMN adenylyltransferase